MSGEKIQTGSYSIVGDRKSQQDFMQYAWSGNTLLAVVCDGMGGLSGGNLASERAVQSIFEDFQAVSELPENQFASWLQSSFEKADREVYQLADANGVPLGAGTTVVALLITEGRFYWGSVGDSRIYILRDNELRTVNRMHNYNLRIQELLDEGEMTEEQAQIERVKGEALISYLGMGGLYMNDVSEHADMLKEDDILILCSDGIYKSLDDQQIQAIVEESGGNMEIAARRLCSEAHRLKGMYQDNATVIAIRCAGQESKDDGTK